MPTTISTETSPHLELRLFPRQAEALRTVATEILYGGSAGSGKSHLARAAAILFCCEVPGLQAYLFRRTYPELEMVMWSGPGGFPALLAGMRAAGFCELKQHEITFWNGSKITLCHCEHSDDVYRFQGSEIHLLCLDELTTFTEKIYLFLRTRCRLGALELPAKYQARTDEDGRRWPAKFPLILCTAMPGNIGHQFVKKTFVTGGENRRLRLMPSSAGGMLRQFLPARLADNPILANSDYANKLRGAGDPETVRAQLQGDWDVVADSVFGASWDRDRHVCRSFPIPSGWTLWRGCDDGYANPACVLWCAYDEAYDRVYVVSELYAAGMLPEELAQRVLERDRSLLIREPGGDTHQYGATLEGIIDPASDADIGTGAPTRAQTMARLGCRWRFAVKGPGSRVQGIMRIHQMLGPAKDGWPRLRIFESCKNLVEALGTAVRDQTNREDIDKNFPLCHATDALSYLLQWRSSSFRTARLTGI